MNTVTIYKYATHKDWDAVGVAKSSYKGGSSGGAFIFNANDYYTKADLQTEGLASVHFNNISDAYHNNLLDIQGGIDTSSGDDSGYEAEYYHLDASTYYDIIGIDFQMSVIKDSANIVTLENDEENPGNSYYYGTNVGGTKGWFALPTGSSSLWEDLSNGFIAPIDSSTVGLYVMGDIQTCSDQTNTRLGISALYSNISSTCNVAIGYEALYNVIDDNSTYPNVGNIAIGYQTIYLNNVEGVGNVAIGYQALYSDTEGNENVAIGYMSLYANTEGTNNVAVGPDALSANTTGSNNVVVGPVTLYTNTIGSNNIGIGDHNLIVNTEGDFNIAIGTNCLYDNVTGDQNVAIGYESLNKNTGNYNFGLGWSAIQLKTTGDYNIGIGYNPLGSLTFGEHNIAIGYYSGVYAADSVGLNSTGNYNILIGDFTKTGTDNDINEIVIGNEAIGQGSNTTMLGGIDTIATYLAGEIYFVAYDSDNALSGSLPLADSSITQIVMYDPSTGKLYYGAGEGGSVSYAFAMSLAESAGTVTLDNDEATPGNSKYYGTDSGGNKGWYDLPESELIWQMDSSYVISPIESSSCVLFLTDTIIAWGTGLTFIKATSDESTSEIYLSGDVSIGLSVRIGNSDGSIPSFTILNSGGDILTYPASSSLNEYGHSVEYTAGGNSSTNPVYVGGSLTLKGGDQTGSGGGRGGHVLIYGGNSVSSVKGSVYIGDSDGTNSFSISEGGEVTLIGNARVQCKKILPLDALGKGVTKPDLVNTGLGDYAGYAFDIGDDGFFQCEPPEAWDASTALLIKIYWLINEAYVDHSAEVNWQLDYSCVPNDMSEAVDAPTHTDTITTGDVNVPALAKSLTSSTFSIPAANIGIDDVIGLHLSRIALVGGANPSHDKPIVIRMELYYTANKLGKFIS